MEDCKMWLTNLLHQRSEIRPACPASAKLAGRAKTLDTVSLSSTSSMSSKKTCRANNFSNETPYQELCRRSQGRLTEADLDQWRGKGWMPFNEGGETGMWCLV
jgi:hypothetical protein